MPETDNPADSSTGLRPLILSFYLPALMVTLGQGLLAPILPLFAVDFDISYGLVGLVLAGEGIGTLIADVPTGMIQRRFGNKQVMMMGIVIKALSIFLLFFAPSIWFVLLLRLIAGFGRSMYTVSAHVYVTNQVGLSQRGKAISMFGGTHRLGGFIGPAIGGIVAGMLGLRAVFIITGLVSAVGFIIVAMFTLSGKRGKGAEGASGAMRAATSLGAGDELSRVGIGRHGADLRADDSRGAHHRHSAIRRRSAGAGGRSNRADRQHLRGGRFQLVHRSPAG